MIYKTRGSYKEEDLLNPWTLLGAQIIAHLSFCYFIFVGEVWQWYIVCFVYFLNGCLGMTMTYHRLLSHRAWIAPEWFEYVGTLFATIGLTGSAISWVAIHRKHHKFADSEKDPHCPHYKGFFYCQWLSMFERVELKYAIDLTKREFYFWQHKYYFLINLIYCLFLFLVDPQAIFYAWLVPACVLWNAGSSIVTLSHICGVQDHKISNKSGNHWILGYLVWGEGWHNNHHHNALNPYFGEKWWQFDLGGRFIHFLRKK